MYNGAIYRRCPRHKAACSRDMPALGMAGGQLVRMQRRKTMEVKPNIKATVRANVFWKCALVVGTAPISR